MKLRKLNIRYNLALLMAAVIISISSCKKFIEVEAPSTSINTKNVYNSDATAAAVLTGLYIDMGMGSTAQLSIVPGLSADELTLFGGGSSPAADYIPVYQNMITSTNSAANFCAVLYPKIYIVNSAVEGLSASSVLTPAVRQQLLGEAYFMRAFYYFYLVNFYGDVPLPIGTDHTINRLLPKSSMEKVYTQIINDLKQASNLLSPKYLKGDAFTPYQTGLEERVRPTRALADAFLARVYLYTGAWNDAEQLATLVIQNTGMFRLASLDEVFLKNNAEAIWQIQSVAALTNATEGAKFILPSTGPDQFKSVYLSDELMNSFEPGDLRKSSWTNSVEVGVTRYNYSYKYKIDIGSSEVKEYTVVMRLAELYMIRAEARAQQSNLDGAKADLNLIRSRAGLPKIVSNDKEVILSSILKERQVELFTEWGHRWFDLKRTGLINQVMPPVTSKKGGKWSSDMQLYPFNLTDLLNDPNLTQNPGYQ